MKPALINAHAQQVLQAVQGTPASHGHTTDLAITRSWRRCLDQHQLDPASRREPNVVEHPRLQDHRAPLEHIISVAHWQMSSLHQQLGRDGHVVLLTDARGVAIDSVFNESERAEFQRSGLWLGSVWSEDCEGTNGVGTCLVERQHVTIRRDEHFRGKHVGLTCSASPIFAANGELLAVLNLSSVREEQSLQQHFKAMALTSLTANLIESCFSWDMIRSDTCCASTLRQASSGCWVKACSVSTRVPESVPSIRLRWICWASAVTRWLGNP